MVGPKEKTVRKIGVPQMLSSFYAIKCQLLLQELGGELIKIISFSSLMNS